MIERRFVQGAEVRAKSDGHIEVSMRPSSTNSMFCMRTETIALSRR